MRVYFAAAMTNTSRDPGVLQRLVEHIERCGHHVPTRHVAHESGRAQDDALTDREVARRDLDWLAGCDALVAEVSTPSHGVGVEVATAVARRLPTLLLSRAGVPVSRLLTGLDGAVHRVYRDGAEATAAVDRFLETVAEARTHVSAVTARGV